RFHASWANELNRAILGYAPSVRGDLNHFAFIVTQVEINVPRSLADTHCGLMHRSGLCRSRVKHFHNLFERVTAGEALARLAISIDQPAAKRDRIDLQVLYAPSTDHRRIGYLVRCHPKFDLRFDRTK